MSFATPLGKLVVETKLRRDESLVRKEALDYDDRLGYDPNPQDSRLKTRPQDQD